MSEGEQQEKQQENKIDDYEIIGYVASGNNTQVLEVSDGGSAHLAMKILLPEAFKDPEQKQVLKREAKVAKTLEHPNLVHFHKVVFTKKHGYMLMDFFRGLNLKAQIGTDLVALQGRIRKLVDGICLALGYMHDKGWIHKDVKPDNILFNKSSELKLIDYSLSTRAASAVSKMFHSKKRKLIQGTRTYIAPETLLKKPETPQTDMYSLGITLFEVLTGQVPFKGASPADLLKKHVTDPAPEPSGFNPNVTPEMDRFVLRLLEKNPKKRHKTMDEVHAEFRSLKVFKEDVHELARQREETEKQKHLDTLDKSTRLDSRSDAMKSELGLSSGKGKTTEQKPVPKAQPVPTTSASAQQPQQSPQQMPTQPYPPQNYPGGYPPGMQAPMPHPGVPPQGYPTQPMPGMMPPPPMPPQGYPGAPGMPPGYPPGAPPQQGQQGMPHPQQQPPYAPPPGSPPNPPQQQPASGQPPAPQPASSPPQQETQTPEQTTDDQKEKKKDDDLPFMDELPDVI